MTITRPLSLEMDHSVITLYDIAPNSSDDLHDHSDFYQISIPLIGHPTMQCNQETRVVRDQQRLVLSPGYQHRHFAGEESVRMLLLFFHRELLERVLTDRFEKPIGSIEFSPWGEGTTDGFRKLAESAIRQTIQRPFEQLELQETEWELATLLLSLQKGTHNPGTYSTLPATHHPAMKRVLDFIHEQADTEVTLNHLTAVAGVSKFHLIRLFREHTGTTPSQYVNELRITRAASMVTRTTDDLTRIAFEVGFGSFSTFERVFKKKYGVTPKDFRKNQNP